MSSNTEYRPCNDPTKPVCRSFVNQGICRLRDGCRFYHPPHLTKTIKKKARREPGLCYCGAPQKKLVNKRQYRPGEDDAMPIFYVVCSRTGKSMRRCM